MTPQSYNNLRKRRKDLLLPGLSALNPSYRGKVKRWSVNALVAERTAYFLRREDQRRDLWQRTIFQRVDFSALIRDQVPVFDEAIFEKQIDPWVKMVGPRKYPNNY